MIQNYTLQIMINSLYGKIIKSINMKSYLKVKMDIFQLKLEIWEIHFGIKLFNQINLQKK